MKSMLTKINGSRFFSKIDMKNAHCQIELDENSHKLIHRVYFKTWLVEIQTSDLCFELDQRRFPQNNGTSVFLYSFFQLDQSNSYKTVVTAQFREVSMDQFEVVKNIL